MYAPTLEQPGRERSGDPSPLPVPSSSRREFPAWLRSPWVAAVCSAIVGLGTGLVVGTGFADKVTLDVDGKLSVVRSFSDDVAGLLGSAGITYDGDDLVRPAASARVSDGMTVLVRHARRLELTIDGRRSTAYVTALNVGDALEALKLDRRGSRVSADWMRQIPVTGFSLQVRTQRKVYVKSGTIKLSTTTTGGTVGQVLKQSGIALGEGDVVRPALGAFPKEGTVIEVLPALPQAAAPPIMPRVADLDWAALARCESRGDPKAYHPGDPGGPSYGLYRFSLPLWQAVGGKRTPVDAPVAEQTYRAQLLYQRVRGRWQGQWPDCGARLDH